MKCKSDDRQRGNTVLLFLTQYFPTSCPKKCFSRRKSEGDGYLIGNNLFLLNGGAEDKLLQFLRK